MGNVNDRTTTAGYRQQCGRKTHLVLGAVHRLPVFALESSRHEHPSVEPVVTISIEARRYV